MTEGDFNADELNPPEWMDEKFITEVLSKHEKSPELKVIDLVLTPASPKGDHYASIMFRAKVKFSTQKGEFSKSLIIKTMPVEEGPKLDMLKDCSIFKTEIGMYGDVLPEMERILRAVGDNSALYVDCIYSSLEPRQIMIFEDLVEMGYDVIRDRYLTQEEIHNAYSKLAKIHANSMKMINERPEYLKEFKTGMVEMPGMMEGPIVNGGWNPFIDFLGRHPELKKYQSHFKKMRPHFKERLAAVMQEYRKNPQPDGYYVLCHGDYHIRNMMFKHNKQTGDFEDCMLIDFQGCNVVPLPVDLMYSIYMLMSPQQRAEECDQLLNYYFSVLVDTLRKIDYQGNMPTLNGFWAAMKRHKYYEFLLLTTALPMAKGLLVCKLPIEELLHNDETRLKVYELEEYVEDATKMLKRFDISGYFDEF
ncbi:hypothetical protein KR009_011741 [Drosophila setifemur]|nr:hypothetical protein KR009_011741 [Drosophila setifemur]